MSWSLKANLIGHKIRSTPPLEPRLDLQYVPHGRTRVFKTHVPIQSRSQARDLRTTATRCALHLGAIFLKVHFSESRDYEVGNCTEVSVTIRLLTSKRMENYPPPGQIREFSSISICGENPTLFAWVSIRTGMSILFVCLFIRPLLTVVVLAMLVLTAGSHNRWHGPGTWSKRVYADILRRTRFRLSS